METFCLTADIRLGRYSVDLRTTALGPLGEMALGVRLGFRALA